MTHPFRRLMTPALGQPASVGTVSDESWADAPRIELAPASLLVSATPRRISTVVGAGIMVCLFDSTTGIGGASHFLMPTAGPSTTEPMRYGSTALRFLLARLMRAGAKRHFLTAKVFGGAQVQSTIREERWNYGVANSDLARSVLAAERIPLHTEDIGGTRGRRIEFATTDGTVWVKVL